MDEKDKEILDLMKGNARISYQELGDAIGMSRVVAKKRVMKLENEGIIRGYNTCIYREGEVTLFIEYVSTRTAFIRQIYKTTKENHIHIVAVSDSITDLRYLMRMIRKKCGDDMVEFHCHAATEVVKDVYGGIRYEQRSESDDEGDH